MTVSRPGERLSLKSAPGLSRWECCALEPTVPLKFSQCQWEWQALAQDVAVEIPSCLGRWERCALEETIVYPALVWLHGSGWILTLSRFRFHPKKRQACSLAIKVSSRHERETAISQSAFADEKRKWREQKGKKKMRVNTRINPKGRFLWCTFADKLDQRLSSHFLPKLFRSAESTRHCLPKDYWYHILFLQKVPENMKM